MLTALLAVVLLPLHFTAPADSLGADLSGRGRMSARPVHSYVFQTLGPDGRRISIPGYADASGTVILSPKAPGSRETVWLAPAANGGPVTVFMLSRDSAGNLSEPSNGCVLGNAALASSGALRLAVPTSLRVPLIQQSPERCGPAALAMVLGFYGANPAALAEADRAYDPVLRGSLITDLALAARRAGYDAVVETLTPDSVIELLNAGVPPILLYQNGRGPVTVGHFGVVTGWNAERGSFTLNDGTARPRVTRRKDLAKRWETAGSQALIIRVKMP